MFGFDFKKHILSTRIAILLVIFGLMIFVWKGKTTFAEASVFGTAVLGFLLYQGGGNKGDDTVETDITKI